MGWTWEADDTPVLLRFIAWISYDIMQIHFIFKHKESIHSKPKGRDKILNVL